MKIAVTGGAGFIASHIVDAYIADGHDVLVVDNLSSGFVENLNPAARFVQMDIEDPAMVDLLSAEKIEVVNHHAAQVSVRRSVREPLQDAHTNVIGSLNVFMAAIRAGARKIIFASSAGTVYGEQSVEYCDEDQPKRPLSPYGASKLSIEQYLFALQQSYDISSVSFRYANVFGPRQNPHGEAGVVAIFLKKILAGETITINGDGLQTRDYIFIQDVVRANMLGLLDTVQGVYNISSGRELSVIQISDCIRDVTKLPVKAEHASPPLGEPRRGCYSAAKAEREIGWRAAACFDEALMKTMEWEKSRYGL